MSGQTQERRFFVQTACFFAALVIALVFSGCPDPIMALEDTVVETPEQTLPSPEDPETPPASALVRVSDSAGLKAALENPTVTRIEVDAGLSLTVDPPVAVPAGSDKTLTVSAGSMVTIRGLSVPAGSALSLYKGEGDSTSQVVLDSLDIGGELSAFGDIYIILDHNNTVAGNLNFYGGTVTVRKGGRIEGSGGSSSVSLNGTVFVGDEDNNFYDKPGAKIKPPAGSFSWDPANQRWEESQEDYPAALADFLAALKPGKYVVRPNDTWPNPATVAAAPGGVKTLVLVGDSAQGNLSSLALEQGAMLKLTGVGTLESGSIFLAKDAEFEVDIGVTLKTQGGGIGDRGKFVVRGDFYNPSMPNWTVDLDARFEFYAGGKVYTSIPPGGNTALYIGGTNDRNDAVISLDSGRIVLTSQQFKLEGNGWLNNGKPFFQPWAGGIYINGKLDVEADFTVKPFGRLPYFELARDAAITVKNGGALSVEGQPISSIITYGRLGEGSKIVVEKGGEFYNEIFPNWEHGGSGDREGAFVFKAGSSVYASPGAFGYSGTGNLLYIGNGSAATPVVKLSQGQIRLSGKTFALEEADVSGKASLESDLTLSGAKLVLKNSELTIGSGKKFTLENKSGEEFVSLEKNAKILVESGGNFTITGPLGGGKTLAVLDSSTVEVKDGGTFYNEIYNYWDISGGGKFIFNAGSNVYKSIGGPLVIGSSGKGPLITLSGAGTLEYAREKITLSATAELSGSLEELPVVWPGFALDIETGGNLTVNVAANKFFTLDGLAVTVKGGFTLKGDGTLTMKNSTVTVKDGGTFTNSLYNSQAGSLKVTYQDDDSAFTVETGGTAFLGDSGKPCEISSNGGAMVQLKSGKVRFNRDEISAIGGEASIVGANLLTIEKLLGVTSVTLTIK
jgi:hypothetical protein